MADSPHPNWQKLHEMAVVEAAPASPRLKVAGLGRDIAVTLAHGLTIRLDRNNGLYMPSSMYSDRNFTLEWCLAEAKGRAANQSSLVFGEERPAERNMAVRVENDGRTYTLAADIRNELEDHPELEGGKLLHLGFTATVESLKF